MAAENKVLKGYIKTENMLLIIILAVAFGFVGGVVFSVYRSTGAGITSGQAASAIPITKGQQEMLTALNERIKADAKDLEAWTQLGHLYFDLGQNKEAIQAYERSLALDSSRPDIWTDLGVMYRRNGDPRKAVETFDKALALDHGHKISLFNKGIVLMHDLNDTKGALDAWEKLLALDPDARTPNGDALKDMILQLKKNAGVQ